MITFGDPIKLSPEEVSARETVTQEVIVDDYVISTNRVKQLASEYFVIGAPATKTITVTKYVCRSVRHVPNDTVIDAYIKTWIANQLGMDWGDIQKQLDKGWVIYATQSEIEACVAWVADRVVEFYSKGDCRRVYLDGALKYSGPCNCQWP